MDPFRAAWLSVRTVELRTIVLEALWWNMVAWIPLLALAWDTRATSLVFIALVGTTLAGERSTVADVLPKIGDDLANEITTR